MTMSERGQQRNEPEEKVREQVEQDRRGGRDLPPQGEPGEAPDRPTNPVRDPDPTEWPDPYDKRPDPRDPASVDTPADPAHADAEEAADPAPRDPTTSDPHPPRSRDRARRDDPPER
jgi:hypothetical protein